MQLPGESDGLDLACAVRDRWPDIAVLVTSGHFGPDGPDDLPAALSFLAKPWTAKTLLAGLRQSIDGRAPPHALS